MQRRNLFFGSGNRVPDCVRAWVEPAFHKDTGKPLIILNHGATEKRGKPNGF